MEGGTLDSEAAGRISLPVLLRVGVGALLLLLLLMLLLPAAAVWLPRPGWARVGPSRESCLRVALFLSPQASWASPSAIFLPVSSASCRSLLGGPSFQEAAGFRTGPLDLRVQPQLQIHRVGLRM